MSNQLFICHPIKIVYDFSPWHLSKHRSRISIEETLEDIQDIDFLILNQDQLFIEERNPSEELVISEEEIAALDTSTMKETSVDDIRKLIYIDEKSENMRVAVQEGGSTERTKSNIKS